MNELYVSRGKQKKEWIIRMAALAALLALPGLQKAWGAPTVTNVVASQRAGTTLVDITYDVDASSPPVFVRIAVSDNGGVTYSTVATHCTGDVGKLASTGTGKKVVWDAGVDWKAKLTKNMRFKVMANDGVAPEGFALIPAGSFEMGNALAATNDGHPDEVPVHAVYVSAFYMAQTETTKAQWDEVRAWGLNNGYTDLPAGSGKASTHPVHTITWYAMVKWCNARSQKEGLTACYTVSGTVYKTGQIAPQCNWSANGYRLPTETEWEKAARGGVSGKRFPWGDTITHSQANYNSWSSFSYDTSPTRGWHPSYNDGVQPYTSQVGSFSANGYGLYDITGNVWEWCWDWYSSSYYQTPDAPNNNPRGPASGSYRVLRGGGWNYDASYGRVAYRRGNVPGSSYYDMGFRPARSAVP